MDLQRQINSLFHKHCKILSLEAKRVHWRKLDAWLTEDSFTPQAREQIKEIEASLKYNQPHAQVIALDCRGEEAVVTTVNYMYSIREYLHTSKDAKIGPGTFSSGGIFITADNYLTINLRSKFLRLYPHCYHSIGGGADSQKDQTSLDTIVREGMEEIGLDRGEIKEPEIKHFAMINETACGFYACSYTIPLTQDKSELEKKKGDGEGSMVFIESKPKEVSSFLLDNWKQFVPSGLVRYILYGASKFGEEWAEAVLNLGKGKPLAQP